VDLVSVSASADDYRVVVGRLRDAGCVFAEEEADVLFAAAGTRRELFAMLEQRSSGTPLEYVVGWAEFCGVRIAVEPGVFVPRRRTELLAREAAAVTRPGAVVVDLCCGSGAISAAIHAAVGGIEVYAVDIDSAAVRCARRNVPTAHVYDGDLYQPLPEAIRGRVDVIVANTPYVPTGEIELLPAEARGYEPGAALDGGADGLDIQRRVIAAAPRWLAPNGYLMVESSDRQVSKTVAALVSAGLTPTIVTAEALGATVVMATAGARTET
jgi:release factor glutamine methyltransferase